MVNVQVDTTISSLKLATKSEHRNLQVITVDLETSVEHEEANPADAWLPITESRKGNAFTSASHLLCSGIGIQALALPIAFLPLGWQVSTQLSHHFSINHSFIHSCVDTYPLG
ncbi:Aa trans domain-containing protein [Abeliophyllum distichum]|uniref:Aa trans domain-containing protein n=1 Tax=Abeliophyllum distichum TaxID=126358 RepID=A0ABD1RQ93_9LAMI